MTYYLLLQCTLKLKLSLLKNKSKYLIALTVYQWNTMLQQQHGILLVDIAKKRNPQPISPEPCENIVIHANFLNANIAPRLPRLSFIPGNRGQNDFMTRLKMTRLPVFIDYCHNIPCWRGLLLSLAKCFKIMTYTMGIIRNNQRSC